jgi:hypothetical protein
MKQRARTTASPSRSDLRELMTVPGIGPSIATDLWGLGVRSVHQLHNRNPELLYTRLCSLAGRPVDRCVLYVFRCAVYYASHQRHQPHLLQWWNWKDRA